METIIRQSINDVLQEIRADKVSFVVEHPNDLSYGDYATNIAMVVSKVLKKSPRECAILIKEKLEGKVNHVEKIEIAGPGFLNFFLSRNFFSNEIIQMKELGDLWGNNDSMKGKEVLIEYTSPNLFKPLHIGNLVGNIVGESIARIFTSCGADVRRLNYPSDIGLTVAKGVWGLLKTKGAPEQIEVLGEAYRIGNDGYENDPQAKTEIEQVNRALYAGSDPTLNALREKGIATSRARLAELCRILGTTFNFEIFESQAAEIGKNIVTEHLADGIFEKSDGAVVFPGEKYGLHTRVFLNSQGLPTYEAKDLGNFTLKQECYPNWDEMFIVTGGEQREYFKVIIKAVQQVFPESQNKRIEHIPTGFLTLTTGKMSSRKGNVLTGESLLGELQEEALERAKETRTSDPKELGEEIAVAALKYQILKQKVGSDILFDKKQALSFEGDSGPYLQYTHARITSVLQKAEGLGIGTLPLVIPKDASRIEKKIYQFSEVIARVVEDRSPHHLLTFLIELAGEFNAFYAKERIAATEDEFASYRVLLASAVQKTLRSGLWMLGIKAPEMM